MGLHSEPEDSKHTHRHQQWEMENVSGKERPLLLEMEKTYGHLKLLENDIPPCEENDGKLPSMYR